MRIVAAALAGGLLTLGACGDSEPTFDEAVESGEPCSVLYEIRNSWPPQDSEIKEANETLRSIGCLSSTSERTDQP